MSKFEKHSQLFVDTLRNIKTSFELVDISLVPVSSSFSSYDKFLYNKFFINVDFLVHQPMIIKSENTIYEKIIFEKLGLPFSFISDVFIIIKQFLVSMNFYDPHEKNYPFVFNSFKYEDDCINSSVWGHKESCNFYSKETDSLSSREFIFQYFVDFENDCIIPKAKISIPLLDDNYYTIIITRETTKEEIESILKIAIIPEMIIVIQNHYPEENIDFNTIDDSGVFNYFELCKMTDI